MANLRGYDQPGQRVRASTALVGLLGALGVPSDHIPPELDDRAWLWRSLLAERDARGQRMLVIADNVSHPDQVRPLLLGTPTHRMLITSRHRLAELDGTRLLDLDILAPDQSAQMLSAVVTMSDPDDFRAASEPEATDRVARLCGGLPLALRVSAALLVAEPEQSMASLADALADGRHRLTELRYDGNLSMRAAFDLSYEHLEPAPARLFRLMALHPGPDMGIAAVAAVAGVDETKARRQLRQLRRAHLVQPGSSPDRWRMHDLLRLYSSEKATDDPDREDAIRRLLEHYVDTVWAAYDHIGNLAPETNYRVDHNIDYRFSERATALAWLDAEHVNVVALINFANSAGYPRRVVNLAIGMHDYFDLRKYWNEWISTHELARACAAQVGDQAAEATLLINLGIVHRQTMQPAAAMSYHRRALSIFRALGDRVGFGRALTHLGTAVRDLGRLNAAMLCHQWSLRLFREAHHAQHECSALHNIAVTHRALGRWDMAVEFHLQTMVNYQRLGKPLQAGRALDILGVAYRALGRMAEAIDCHRENIKICEELLDVHGAAKSNANLAVTYREAGRPAEATECHLAALRTFRTIGPRHTEAAELVELGRTHQRAGRYADAARCWSEAMEIFETLPGQGSARAESTRAALTELNIGDIARRSATREEPSVSDQHEPAHRLSQTRFDKLCAGAVDADTVAALKDGQHSKQRLLLSTLVAELNGRVGNALDDVEQAWQVLTAADDSAPTVLAEVVTSPAVSVWLVRMLRRLRGTTTDGPELMVELGFLSSVAGAVAIRSRTPCVLDLPAINGVITLPTVGQIRFDTEGSTVPATLTVTPDRVDVRVELAEGAATSCAIPDGTDFFPAHRLEVVTQGKRLAVEIDDSTPYREFSAPVAPEPLTHAKLNGWTAHLTQAWQVITQWHPQFADEISAGITTLTPIPSETKIIGKSSPLAFGAVAVSLANTAESLAAALVHELQHSKFNALCDLVQLHTDTSASWYVPWRDDPRPLSGALHGIYSFTSEAEFWNVQRHHVPATAALPATFQLIYRVKQVNAVINAVHLSQNLTSAGREFVAAAARRLRRCAVDDVPTDLVDLIDTIMVEHRATWRLRHLRPDVDYVADVISAWRAGEPAPPARSHTPTVIPFRRTLPPSNRPRLLTARCVESREPSGTGPDLAFATEAYDDAADGYTRRLASTPEDEDAWIGLGLTLRAVGNTSAAQAFLDAPETTLTSWQRLADASTPPPVMEFGRWLGAE
jgi:HEXXH motif-containing protein